MNPILNFFLCTSDGITDTLLLKLSAYYHKMVTGCPVRLITCAPIQEDTINEPRMFDETVECRFMPAEPLFWETKEIQKYIMFSSHSTNILGFNILVAERIVTPHASCFGDMPLTDFVYAKLGNNHSAMIRANNFVAEVLNCSPLPENELKYYDTSLFGVSDEARPIFNNYLARICKNYNSYIDKQYANAILSVVSIIMQKQGMSIGLLDAEYVNLQPNSIKDFYMIT